MRRLVIISAAMPRRSRSQARRQGSSQLRRAIAHQAARLLVEAGHGDYALAKRKALQQLGLADNIALPEDAEVAAALQEHLDVFHAADTPVRLRLLRREALRLMQFLAHFRPYVHGALLDGQVLAHTPVELAVYVDSGKELEIFLLDQRVDFEHLPLAAAEPAELRLQLHNEQADFIVTAYPHAMERQHRQRQSRTGRPWQLDQAGLERLLDAASHAHDPA